MTRENALIMQVEQSLLEQVVRVHDEPYKYYDDWDVHALLTQNPVAYIDHIMTRLKQIADGNSAIELPDKLVFDDGDEMSDFRVMPCVIRHPDSVSKTVKIVGTNGRQKIVPDQITVGKAFALHPEENYVTAGFAGCLLSSARTGACVASAARLLAERSTRVLIVGAGRVGYYSGLYVCALGNTSQLQFSDTDRSRADRAATLLHSDFHEIDISVADADIDDTDFDIVILATDSRDTIYGDQVSLPALTISVGADTHWQHEITRQQLSRSDIYVDTQDSFNCGDLKHAISTENMDTSKITDLFSLLRDGKRLGDSPSLFISTGSALFDNLTIEYILGTSVQK
jgi:ornithine cyclodeaminase/alanine dehydrogenase-like protein (mu-crystallin family)